MRPKPLLLILIFLVTLTSQGICQTIEWTPYKEGIVLAEKEKKKIFLHFRAEWCVYCDEMERVTFKDPEVIQFLNKNFISIKVDGDRERAVAKAHRVTGYPDTRFLDGNKEAFRLPGYIDPLTFFFFLEYIHTESYKTMDPLQYYKTR